LSEKEGVKGEKGAESNRLFPQLPSGKVASAGQLRGEINILPLPEQVGFIEP